MSGLLKHLFYVPSLFTTLVWADVVADWNNLALDAIRANNTTPPAASRNLAILHVSIYDAVNGIRKTHRHYSVAPTGPAGASIEAAAAAAGRRVLMEFYPGLQSKLETQYNNMIQSLPSAAQTQQGVQWGDFVASSILQSRSNDGSSNTVVYTPGTQPGQWRPTISFGGVVRQALLANWGSVRPFALVSGMQFRPPAPPPLTTPQYAADVNSVKALGAFNSITRTAEQTEIASFWGYGSGSATPPGHWNQVAQEVAGTGNHGRKRCGIEENARLFALLNIALADAAIVSWDSKYIYNFWRPITAIQEDNDGNPATQSDPSWIPLLPTPPFPEYTSGHSAFSGAAAVLLAYFFGGDRIHFEVGSDDMPGVRRSFNSFSEAAFESGISRIYGGIHFSNSNVQGLSIGAAVGTFVAWNYLRPVSDQHQRTRRVH
jgi:PAP2 superfamily